MNITENEGGSLLAEDTSTITSTLERSLTDKVAMFKRQHQNTTTHVLAYAYYHTQSIYYY